MITLFFLTQAWATLTELCPSIHDKVYQNSNAAWLKIMLQLHPERVSDPSLFRRRYTAQIGDLVKTLEAAVDSALSASFVCPRCRPTAVRTDLDCLFTHWLTDLQSHGLSAHRPELEAFVMALLGKALMLADVYDALQQSQTQAGSVSWHDAKIQHLSIFGGYAHVQRAKAVATLKANRAKLVLYSDTMNNIVLACLCLVSIFGAGFSGYTFL